MSVIDTRPIQPDWQNPVPHRPAWQNDAACRGLSPELFFPERGANAEVVKAVCQTCPVITQCLDYAVTNGERFGIWGGKSERERRRLRRPRAAPSRVCPCCGDTFRPSGKTHRFCSADCRSYHQHRGAA